MQSCSEGSTVSWPKRWACSWSSEVPQKRSDPCVCLGWDWVRKTALDRKWSPPTSCASKASAIRTSVLETIVMWSRQGSSDFRTFASRNSKSRPVAAGAKRCCSAPHSLQPGTPCTSSMHTSRVGCAAPVAPRKRPAGNMASRRGSATVAPAPRRKVRRGTVLPVRKCICPRVSSVRGSSLAVIVTVFAVRMVQTPVDHVVSVAVMLDRLVAAACSVHVPVDMVHAVVFLVFSHQSSSLSMGFKNRLYRRRHPQVPVSCGRRHCLLPPQ